MNDAVRLPLGLGVLVGAVVVGAATLLPWRAGVGIEGLGGQVALTLALALGLIGAFAIRDPSNKGDRIAALVVTGVVLAVAVGYVATDAGLVPAACDDTGSCASIEMVPASVGLGLIAVIVGCLVVGVTALVGARHRA